MDAVLALGCQDKYVLQKFSRIDRPPLRRGNSYKSLCFEFRIMYIIRLFLNVKEAIRGLKGGVVKRGKQQSMNRVGMLILATYRT